MPGEATTALHVPLGLASLLLMAHLVPLAALPASLAQRGALGPRQFPWECSFMHEVFLCCTLDPDSSIHPGWCLWGGGSFPQEAQPPPPSLASSSRAVCPVAFAGAPSLSPSKVGVFGGGGGFHILCHDPSRRAIRVHPPPPVPGRSPSSPRNRAAVQQKGLGLSISTGKPFLGKLLTTSSLPYTLKTGALGGGGARGGAAAQILTR